MQPNVQSLDEILAQLDPAYSQQRGLYQQQQGLIHGQTDAAVTGLDAAKTNAFHDVNTNANSKGLAFSGIPAAEQTRYLGEKYLPAVAGIKQDAQKQSFTLAKALAGLESDKRLKGMDIRGGQQKTLDSYLENERQRQFQADQSAQDRTFRASQGAIDRSARASQNATDNSDPTAPFLSSFASFMKGNKKMASRQEQDNYINSLFNNYGIKDKGARQVVWDSINAQFKRSGDPTKDWTYRKK